MARAKVSCEQLVKMLFMKTGGLYVYAKSSTSAHAMSTGMMRKSTKDKGSTGEKKTTAKKEVGDGKPPRRLVDLLLFWASSRDLSLSSVGL